MADNQFIANWSGEDLIIKRTYMKKQRRDLQKGDSPEPDCGNMPPIVYLNYIEGMRAPKN
jgi:hypothetical protein